MHTVKTEQGYLHYLSRQEYQTIIFLSKKDPVTRDYTWSDKFKEGDVIHISETNGSTSNYIVRRALTIEHF